MIARIESPASRNDPTTSRRGVGGGFVYYQGCADAVLAALRSAGLAVVPAGEQREEWGIRWDDWEIAEDGVEDIDPCGDEVTARNRIAIWRKQFADGGPYTLMKRRPGAAPGPWVPVTPEEG